MNGVAQALVQIDEVVKYLVPGFIFLECRYYIGKRNRDPDISIVILRSICVSYLLAYIEPSWLRLLVAVLGGAFFGLLLRYDRFNQGLQALLKLDTHDNLFSYLDSLSNRNVMLRFKIKGHSEVYTGVLHEVFNPSTVPTIVIKYYYTTEKSETGEERLLLDYKKYKNVYFAVHYADIEFLEYIAWTEDGKSGRK